MSAKADRTGPLRPEFLPEQAQLAKSGAQLDWMERIALSPEASRDFIRHIANSL